MDEPIWLPRVVVEAMHADQLQQHGGRPGLRDADLLESALARPKDLWRYQPLVDLAALAAAVGFGLVRNHAFIDGNKRTAFVCLNVFLMLNGLEIEAPEPEVVDVMVRLASGGLDQDGLATWIRLHSVPYGD